MSSYTQVPLGEICKVNPRAKETGCRDDTVVSFVPMATVDGQAGEIAVYAERPFAEVDKGYTSFENGDILFAKITPCMENGKVALAQNLSNGIGRGSTEFYVLRPGERVLGEYIYHFVRQPQFREEAKKNFTGTAGQQRVPKSFVQNAPVPLPPLAEQRRIVGILNRAARIERLRKQAQERLQEFVPALFVKMFGDPATNPMGWETAPLGNVIELAYGKSLPVRVRKGGSVPVYGSNGVVGWHNESLVQEPTVIVGRKGSAGAIHLTTGPSYPIDTTYYVRTKLGFQPDIIYISYVLKFADLSRIRTETGVPGLNREDVYKEIIPLPPLEEQRKFAKLSESAYNISMISAKASKFASTLGQSLMSGLLEDAA